jgi:four helix bundle protein
LISAPRDGGKGSFPSGSENESRRIEMTLRIYRDVLSLAREMRGVLAGIAKQDADLARQTRRALTSIALNTAEGSQQRGGNGRLRFQTAMGSGDEVRACLEISAALGYIDDQPRLVDAFDRVARTLFNLMRR